MCESALERASFLCYCMDNIEGCMREKLFLALEVEVKNCPKLGLRLIRNPKYKRNGSMPCTAHFLFLRKTVSCWTVSS